MMGISSP
jgi:hypothetical protein